MVFTDPFAWHMSVSWLLARIALIRIHVLEQKGLHGAISTGPDATGEVRMHKKISPSLAAAQTSDSRTHVCLFGPATSEHTRRIAQGLAERGGYSVTAITMHAGSIPGVDTISLFSETPRMKMEYLLAVPRLRTVLKQLRPDVLHAHYASSYGLVAALTGFNPLVVSAWGSDVYDFPRHGLVSRAVIRYVFARADAILSTSAVMATEISHYSAKKVVITPYGIDTATFKPSQGAKDSTFVIGTVKDLKHVYGIDILLRIFAVVARRHPDWSLQLDLLGDGPEFGRLQSLVEELGVGRLVHWEGHVSHDLVAQHMREWSVAVFLSRQESYGVGALEAQACAIPVIVSDAPGFTEVVVDGVTGVVVPREAIMEAAMALETLYENPELRQRMGSAARNFVCKQFGPSHPFEEYSNVYAEVIEENGLGR